MIAVRGKTVSVVDSITITLSGDDISHFAYLLSTWKNHYTDKTAKQGGWDWLARLAEEVEKARTV